MHMLTHKCLHQPLPQLPVLSGSLEWQPQGQQTEHPNFQASGGIRPVDEDILIAKLRAGQVGV